MDSIVNGLCLIRPELKGRMELTREMNEEEVWEYSPLLRLIKPFQDSDEYDVACYFEKLIEVFSSAILNFLYFTRPQLLFLAGRTVQQLPSVFNAVVENIRQKYDLNFMKNIQCIRSQLDDTLVIQGASFLVINNYIEYFGKGGG